MKVIIFLLGIIQVIYLLFSCTSSKPGGTDFTEESFKDTFHLKNGKICKIESLFVGHPTSIRFHPDSFLILQDMGTPRLVKIIDLKRNKVQEIIPQGKGPGEMIVAWGIQILGKDLYVFCGQLRKVIVLTPENNREFRITKEFNLEENQTTAFCPLKTDIMVCLSNIGEDKRLTFLDNTGKISSKLGDFPPILNGKKVKKNNYIFQGYIEAAPDGNRFVLACARTDVLEIYNLDKGLVKRFQGPVGIRLNITNKDVGAGTMFNFQPSYLTYSLGDANDNEFWFGYAGYNDGKKERPSLSEVSPKEIFCFDWFGDPLRKIDFDNTFVAFDVDWNGKVLYLLEWKNENPEIVSYSLNDILK